MTRRRGALAALPLILLLVGLVGGGSVAASPSTGAAPTAAPVAAQFGSEGIRSYEVGVTINSDGSVDVTERIAYDFGSNRRRGIFRRIPVRYPYEQRNEDGSLQDDGRRWQRRTPISGFRVTSPTAPTQVERTDEDDYAVFRIGNPNRFITGTHDYELRYRLGSVMNGFDEHDELYLDVIGTQWDVPIESVTATISADGAPERVACYAGPEGSRLTCDRAEIVGNEAQFAHARLAPREGLSAVVALPKGVVAEPEPDVVELWSVRHAFDPGAPKVATGGVVLAGGLAGVGWLLWRNGRDRRFAGSAIDAAFGNETGEVERVPLREQQAAPVEFVPPDGIRPGHMGTLWDEHAHPLDVSAMIVDLAVRGYLRIDELSPPSKSIFGERPGDYRFVKLRPADQELLRAEQLLLDAIFQTRDEVLLSNLRTKFASRLSLVQGALYDDTVKAGWFPTRPDRVRARWHAIGLGVTILGAGLAALIIWKTSWGLAALPLPVIGLVLLALGSKFPHRTAKGTAMLSRVQGFKELFDVGEGERQRWLEDKGAFSRYLPYAIVFGCAERWAETFAELGATPEEMGIGVWYTSPYPINPFAFGWVVGSFSTTTTGSIAAAAQPTTSGGGISGGSGFGGGGFSGGGFGGGGGGSW